ncbi:MAG TPA: MOSC N-terminal beta barrel domain-containing protein [Caulobacteraceae bacterium]|nr:MOSC N-terminal beta barrel domain-containing protein [Caulobacteraceae bacterium]
MTGRIASLWRHPVKGFTPERLAEATLTAGGFFPCDRIYAVEDGPSGFDPAAPAWITKQKFTVLAKIAEVARARTAYDETSGVLSVSADGREPLCAPLKKAKGREAFAAWLSAFLGEAASGPLKVVEAPGHRFTDHPRGEVSIVNLASVRDLEARVGRPIDPLRFRANLYVEGWPAWIENHAKAREVNLGPVTARVFSSIVRCAATHVDPTTGERDMDLVGALHANYGHMLCGVYVSILEGGRIGEGDAAEIRPV